MTRRVWWGVGAPPRSAAWPRLMTGRHPRAVGTYGPDAVGWAEAQRLLHPRRSEGTRWWQRLAMARALEHDASGRLVWPVVVISGPRQTGKSWLERMAVGWRISHAPVFGGDEQAVLHIAHKLDAAQEVWRPAARWAAASDMTVRRANGEQRIEMDDGSRWLLQAANDGAGVSYSLSMALIDEAWRVPRRVYEEGIEPTLAEAYSPQTWLVSTAGTSDSDLVATYRSAGIATLGAPEDVLLIEWSAPEDPELDIDDPRVWRACQPHWDERRREWIARKRSRGDERAFRQQALNQWVPSLAPPALVAGTWDRVVTRGGPAGELALGAEVADDHSRSVIVALGANGVAEVIEDQPGAHWVAGRLAELCGRYAVGGVGVDASGPSRGLAAELRGTELPLVALTAGDMSAASGQVFDAFGADPPLLRLHDDGRLQSSVVLARRRKSGGSWAWSRDAHGTALIAVTAAWWAAGHAAAVTEAPAVYA